MAQLGEVKLEHNGDMGHPGEGAGMGRQSPGGVRRVSTQRGSHGESKPKQKRKPSL